MNLFRLLLKHPDYLRISLAILISGIGSSLTTIAIYGELSNQNAPAWFYSIAFALRLIPALFTSMLAAKASNKLNWGIAIIIAEVAGAVSLLFPVLGVTTGILLFLLVTEFTEASIAGFISPFDNIYVRRNFKDEELPAVSVWSVYTFSANFILGELIGVLLYTLAGIRLYLLIDLFTYAVAIVLVWSVWRKKPENFKVAIEADQSASLFRWKKLSSFQKRAFLLSPILAFVCAPSMSLLPAMGAKYGKEYAFFFLTLSPAVVFLLCKTLGQILGPTIIQRLHFDRLTASNPLIVACLVCFLTFYYFVAAMNNFLLGCVFVVFAHIFSNIIFILGYYSFNKSFKEEEIGPAAARQFQVMMILMTFSGFWAGFLAETSGFVFVVYVGFACLPVVLYVLHGNSGEE